MAKVSATMVYYVRSKMNQAKRKEKRARVATAERLGLEEELVDAVVFRSPAERTHDGEQLPR
jgi:hypothetical protein